MNSAILGRICFLAAVAGLLASGANAYLLPHIPLVWQISLAVTVMLFVASLVLERGKLAESFSKRTTRYGLNSIFMSVLALGIVVMVNFIASEHDIKKDVTKNKLHTLSDQSVKVVKGLKEEVTLKAFVMPNNEAGFQGVFDKYTYHSKLLKAEFVDPDKDPMAIKRYAVKSAGTLVIESATRTARVENLQGPEDPKIEEKITNALIQVAKGDKKKIYFVSGHGEHLPSGTGPESYSDLKEVLEGGRYKVEDLILYEKGEVPKDAEILVCAGPRSDFLEPELRALEQYVTSGGKFFLMLEPDSTGTIRGFLAKFGVNWQPKKAVLELNPLQQLARGNPLTPIVVSYDTTHEITRDMKQPTLFPIATVVEKAKETPKDMTVTQLLSSSARSFEVQFAGTKVNVNQKTDRPGPLAMAVAVSGKVAATHEKKDDKAKTEAKASPEATPEEKKDGEFRVVIIGDSDFATNGARKFGLNADFFENSLSWLAKEEDLISIRPRSTDVSEFEITEQRTRIIFLSSVLGAPLIMLVLGMYVWVSRKRK
ncbi:MAG: GldG family protein [Deltaproteobacteria bacterium]|nr:GldG family protein [Deltaproteobacteria bacterium]